MRRGYSPQYYSPPRRGYGGGDRGRSPPPPRRSPPPPRRGYGGGGGGGGGGGRGGGGYGGRKDSNDGSLLVRNIPMSCRPEDLRVPFERFGQVRDVYLPKDYYTGEPRGFAFVQFVDPYDAGEAQYHMNGQLFFGREITVVVAAETRKRPEEMRHRGRPTRGPSGYGGGGRRPFYGRSRSRSLSRSRSPRYTSGSRGRYRSRSNSPAPRRRADYSVSPRRRPEDHSRSPMPVPHERDNDHPRRSPRRRPEDHSRSPGYVDADRIPADGKPVYVADEDAPPAEWRSPGRASRSPSGSRSRSADLSPRSR